MAKIALEREGGNKLRVALQNMSTAKATRRPMELYCALIRAQRIASTQRVEGQLLRAG